DPGRIEQVELSRVSLRPGQVGDRGRSGRGRRVRHPGKLRYLFGSWQPRRSPASLAVGNLGSAYGLGCCCVAGGFALPCPTRFGTILINATTMAPSAATIAAITVACLYQATESDLLFGYASGIGLSPQSIS